jgi:hypothetical protein
MKTITRTLLAALLLSLGIFGAACQDEVATSDSTTAESVDAGELSPDELGRIGARLHEAPDDAEAILADEGITWEDYQAAVREVSADVESAQRYSEAFHAANGTTGADQAANDPAG